MLKGNLENKNTFQINKYQLLLTSVKSRYVGQVDVATLIKDIFLGKKSFRFEEYAVISSQVG
jgi:hypothetical protein